MQQVINSIKVIKSYSVGDSIIEVLNRRDPSCPRGPSRPDFPYLLRIFPLIQPLFPLRKDYFNQNNIDLHVEIIHCIQAIKRHWSREPITTLSAPSMFMSRFFRTDYHAGQISTYFHTTPAMSHFDTGFTHRQTLPQTHIHTVLDIMNNYHCISFNWIHGFLLSIYGHVSSFSND